MSVWVRLMEKLSGSPHQHSESDMVHAAAARLSERAEELAAALKPYRESEDPLVMLLTDAIVQRGFAEGTGNAKTELHP